MNEEWWLEIMAFAMHAALLVQFVDVNKEHQDLDKAWFIAAVEQLNSKTPSSLILLLAQWLQTASGSEWLQSMHLDRDSKEWVQFLEAHKRDLGLE